VPPELAVFVLLAVLLLPVLGDVPAVLLVELLEQAASPATVPRVSSAAPTARALRDVCTVIPL
jgi:hypothetical protein